MAVCSFPVEGFLEEGSNASDANCVAWEPVHINAGDASQGFSIDQGNLKWSEKNGFGGWLGMCSSPWVQGEDGACPRRLDANEISL